MPSLNLPLPLPCITLICFKWAREQLSKYLSKISIAVDTFSPRRFISEDICLDALLLICTEDLAGLFIGLLVSCLFNVSKTLKSKDLEGDELFKSLLISSLNLFAFFIYYSLRLLSLLIREAVLFQLFLMLWYYWLL